MGRLSAPGRAQEVRCDFAAPDVMAHRRPDGSIVLSSRQPLSPHPATILEWLALGADRHPSRPLLCEPGPRGWIRHSFAGMLADAETAASGWLQAGLQRGDRVLVVAPNGYAHLVASLSALRAGLVTCPLPARLLDTSSGMERLEAMASKSRARAVFVAAPMPQGLPAWAAARGLRTAAWGEAPGGALDLSRAAHGVLPPLPDRNDIARIVFTSGSVGSPKGVVYTHGMMTANLQMTLDLWPFLRTQPPVLLDWLPWHHVFGGNNNVNLVLALGGTLHVDDGAPVAGGTARTIEHLHEISPTLYCAVPAGLAALIPHLERDAGLRQRFLARLRAVFTAGAALPAPVAAALRRVAREAPSPVHLVAGWGATETGPGATLVHVPDVAPLNIGTPTPGTSIKLAPVQGRLELRVRGPAVTPGYDADEELTRAAFDEEGYWRSGDAAYLQDERDPNQGFVFDGRLAEDFKLANGSWVAAGALRLELIRASGGLIRDAVICGEGRGQVGALVWLTDEHTSGAQDRLQELVRAQATRPPTTCIARVLVLRQPADAASGEINDKGYVHQARCRHTRAQDIARLYAEAAPDASAPIHGTTEILAC